MSEDTRIRTSLERLVASGTSDEERKDRLWQHGIAEIDVQRVECAALREKVIAECKRQNGGAK